MDQKENPLKTSFCSIKKSNCTMGTKKNKKSSYDKINKGIHNSKYIP